MKASKRKGCDQCQALMIQGVFCHEIGCPNAKKTNGKKRLPGCGEFKP